MPAFLIDGGSVRRRGPAPALRVRPRHGPAGRPEDHHGLPEHTHKVAPAEEEVAEPEVADDEPAEETEEAEAAAEEEAPADWSNGEDPWAE